MGIVCAGEVLRRGRGTEVYVDEAGRVCRG